MKNFNMIRKMLCMSKASAAITAVCLLTCLFASSVFAAELPSSTLPPAAQPQTIFTLENDINEDITIPYGKNIKIIGNGHAVNGTVMFAAENGNIGGLTTAVFENLVFNGGLLHSSAIVSRDTSSLTPGSINLTLKNCSFQNYNSSALNITNASSLVVDSCSFTNNSVGTAQPGNEFTVDINLHLVQNNKLEFTNNTFFGCCGTKAAIRIAQQKTAKIVNPVKLSGNIFNYAADAKLLAEPPKSDLAAGLEHKANEYINEHSSEFGININENKTAVRFWNMTDKTENYENIVVVPLLKQLLINSAAAASAEPSAVPTATLLPEPTDTAAPTEEPTIEPTEVPSAEPTAAPAETPTAEPSEKPTEVPEETPTAEPTLSPTAEPTATPVIVPSLIPTSDPTATASADEKYSLNIEFIGNAAERTGVLVYINGVLANTKNITAYSGDTVSFSAYVDDNARVTDITVNGVSVGIGKSFIMPVGGANAVITSRRYGYSPNSGLSTATSPPIPTPSKTPRPSALPTPTPIPEPPIPFTDVHIWDWYYDNVCSVYKMGLMNGTYETIFEPNTATTRAMMVTIIHRMEGAPKVTAYTPFYDIPQDTWYTNAVDWAFKNKIVNGMGNGLFEPAESITREQMATMFYRYMQWRGDGPQGAWAVPLNYNDAWAISDWAAEGVMFCTMTGLMQGNDDGSFSPQNNATRAEIAAVVDRAAKIIDHAKPLTQTTKAEY